MKKFQALFCASLLASAGTMLGVTCAQDNVPAATLLVPHFKVEATVSSSNTLSNVTADTLVAVTNVSTTGLIAHVTVWNKYSAPVFDFNIALTGQDVATFTVSSLLNGDLTPNWVTHNEVLPNAPFNRSERGIRTASERDPCGVRWVNGQPDYAPRTGFGQTTYVRFSHPQGGASEDATRSISIYPAVTASRNAFGNVPSLFQKVVLNSLDENADVTSFLSPGNFGSPVLARWSYVDAQGSPADNLPTGPASFSGYITIDVVNYCTNYFPDQPDYYEWDAIATTGWRETCGTYTGTASSSACTAWVASPAYTPNALIGDWFYVDPKAGAAGNVSGDTAVAVEFDERLNQEPLASDAWDPKTFYGRYELNLSDSSVEDVGPFGSGRATVPFQFRFAMDGREPLGERFGFRYMNQPNVTETYLLAWRSSVYRTPDSNPFYVTPYLSRWLNAEGPRGSGLFDEYHALVTITLDEHERGTVASGSPFPSGCPDCQGTVEIPYIFLESQRIRFAGAAGINPMGWPFGWVDMRMKSLPANITPYFYYPYMANQAWLGVEHSATGTIMSVGHTAHLLDGDFLCRPIGTTVLGRLFNPVGISHQPDNLSDALTRWYPGILSLQFNPDAGTFGVKSPK